MSDKSGSAFPSIHQLETGLAGLTKREYFAAIAMQGMLANSYQQDALNQNPLSYANKYQIAEMAVGQADALLAELSKKGE